VGYRREVVFQNLSNSFPEKDTTQLKQIEKEYYRYLCDLVVESIKTITMSEAYVRKRLTFHSTEKVNALYEEGKSIIVVMGHFGNWELAGPCFSLNCKHQLNVVYKPLSNPYFEKLFSGSRTRFGTKIIPVNNTLRAMAANRKSLNATALIADQTPSDTKTGFWLDFLHQDTLVFTGPEKIGKMFDAPIVYMHVDRVKRGYYEITPTVLFAQPKTTTEEEITRAFFQKLENEIIAKPETWLWSHKRWKKTREVKN
jgi:KDO2-lipid IV(A) lauroyltransferase